MALRSRTLGGVKKATQKSVKDRLRTARSLTIAASLKPGIINGCDCFIGADDRALWAKHGRFLPRRLSTKPTELVHCNHSATTRATRRCHSSIRKVAYV